MSGVYILKNVYNFAQILNLAASDHLKKWDESTLKKALHWAHYCEEVYKHVLQQGYAKDIDPKIIQLTTLLRPPSFQTLNFDCLRLATKLIVETVLTNSHASTDLKKRLETLIGPSVWSEVSGKIQARPPFSDLDKSFSILWIQNQAELQTIKERTLATYAKILLTNVLTIKVTSENEERFHQYLGSMFDRLVSLQRGWELVVSVFSVDPESLPYELESMTESLLSIVVSWMEYRMNHVIRCPILDLKLDVLQQASVNSSDFFSFYMSTLEKWGEQFQPFIGGLSNDVWRDDDGNGASHLSSHFHHLLASDCVCRDSGKDLKSQVLDTLTRNIRRTDFSVWRTVAKSLLG